MADDATQRDLVWAAVLEQSGSFETGDLYDELPDNHYERPSHETIKRVLRAGTELGVLSHRRKSPLYSIQREYDPRHRPTFSDIDVRKPFGQVELQLSNSDRRESERAQIEMQPDRARELGEQLIKLAEVEDQLEPR